MATATTKTSSVPSPDPSNPSTFRDRLGAGFRSVYRFFASLKLAMFSLGSLAAVLAYGTFFESWYGTGAAQDWIYRSKGFAILLAFLATNILCAALIRYPWKKRQTGFVITHAGLLTLLAGSFWTLNTADEGQVGALEGETKSQLVRLDHPVIRVRKIDPETREPIPPEYELPFQPGTFAWGKGNPKQRGLLESLWHKVTLGGSETDERLTGPKDPFTLVAKAHLPASIPAVVHLVDPAGMPMAKIRPRFKGPAMLRAIDVFEDDRDRWFKTGEPFFRVVKTEGPARFAFLYVDKPELIEDFLNPPPRAGKDGVARLRYRDKSGKPKRYDWPLDGQAGKSVKLPESDLVATFVQLRSFPAAHTTIGQTLAESSIPVAQFKVREGDGPELDHVGVASLPMFPSPVPAPPQKALIEIHYDLPPALDPKSNGLFGVVEVLGTPDGQLYYRVFGRGDSGIGQLRDKGRIKLGQDVVAFGGKPGQPMTISFRVEEYLPSGREKEICEPIDLPKAQLGNGIPATLVDMTVDGQTEEFWIRRPPTLDPSFQRVTFPSGMYEVAYDVDRKDLGFQLRLDDFDVGFDPGTEQASSYVSKVRLSDPSLNIHEKPITIAMNEPLTHRGYTFYQSSYVRVTDPRTGRETGQFQSVFQVGSDPGRMVKYAGCLMVVLGAFVQFYMRAGIFTDGGKRERALAAAKAARKRGDAQPGPDATAAEAEEPL